MESEKNIQRHGAETQRVIPATDIVELEDGFHIFVDMPGVTGQDLKVDLEEGELTIEAHSGYTPREGARNLHSEFAGFGYRRAFTLSDVVDREKIKAVFKDGVLDLHLPKTEASKPRRIQIEAS
jgi:HSP20 family molecular chaperone IbpA